MKVSVTEDHINNGRPCNKEHCPIAEALIESFPNAFRILVDNTTVKICHRFGARGELYALPVEASDFINEFDFRGAHSVQPIEFEMERLL